MSGRPCLLGPLRRRVPLLLPVLPLQRLRRRRQLHRVVAPDAKAAARAPVAATVLSPAALPQLPQRRRGRGRRKRHRFKDALVLLRGAVQGHPTVKATAAFTSRMLVCFRASHHR